MRNLIVQSLALLSLALFAVSARAESALPEAPGEFVSHEIGGGTSAGIEWASDSFIDIHLYYGHFFTPNFEVMISTGYQTAYGVDTEYFMVGPTWNFGADPLNALFVEGQIGFVQTRPSSSKSSLIYGVGTGKRFKLTSHVVWKPEVSLSGSDQKGSVTYFSVSPLQFSFLF